jgi:transcriptional regulator with XRE-family HTH domain
MLTYVILYRTNASEGARVRVEQIVGSRMRERREELGLTQEHIGSQFEPLLGRPWSRQAVSAAEKGDRSFAAAELVALAAVLHVTVSDLLRPPVHEPEVYLGGPYPVPRDVLLALVTARVRDDLNLTAIQDALTLLADTAARGQEDIAQTLKLARDLDMLITQRVADGGVVRMPYAEGYGPDEIDPLRPLDAARDESHDDHATGPEHPGAAS